MKTFVCLVLIAITQLFAQAQEKFGGKTEGGGPGGSPATNCPCWRYPIRIINYRKVDLRPQFEWWRENYAAYQSAFAAADKTGQKPDLSTLIPPPLPGWHRIKEGRFISNVAYGWLCQAVIEDWPSHTMTNKIIIRNPPNADKASWDELVDRYYELKEEASTPRPPSAAPRTHHNSSMAGYPMANQQAAAQFVQYTTGKDNSSTTSSASHHHAEDSGVSDVLAELKKFPEGTNYTVDLFALKIGYIQDGSHRQVYDLGQMYSK